MKPLLFSLQVGKDTAETAAEEHHSSAFQDKGEKTTEDVGSEKPETTLGCREELSTQAGVQEQKPVANKRYAFCFSLLLLYS